MLAKRFLTAAVLTFLIFPWSSVQAQVHIGVGIGVPVYRPYYRPYYPYRVYVAPAPVYVTTAPAPVYVVPSQQPVYIQTAPGVYQQVVPQGQVVQSPPNAAPAPQAVPQPNQ